MNTQDLAERAADAALFQRQHGDQHSLRELYAETFSLLRYFHSHWNPVAHAA